MGQLFFPKTTGTSKVVSTAPKPLPLREIGVDSLKQSGKWWLHIPFNPWGVVVWGSGHHLRETMDMDVFYESTLVVVQLRAQREPPPHFEGSLILTHTHTHLFSTWKVGLRRFTSTVCGSAEIMLCLDPTNSEQEQHLKQSIYM